jgi:hypothetical protein
MAKQHPPHNPEEEPDEASPARNAPEYVDKVDAKRRARRGSIESEGGLKPGAHGVLPTDEDVSGSEGEESDVPDP